MCHWYTLVSTGRRWPCRFVVHAVSHTRQRLVTLLVTSYVTSLVTLRRAVKVRINSLLSLNHWYSSCRKHPDLMVAQEFLAFTKRTRMNESVQSFSKHVQAGNTFPAQTTFSYRESRIGTTTSAKWKQYFLSFFFLLN